MNLKIVVSIMGIYALMGLLNAITSSVFGVIVFTRNRKSLINIGFSLFCLTVAIWSYSYFFWQISTSRESALFWARALMSGAIFIPLTYLFFVFAFTNKLKEKKKFIIFGLLYFIPFFFLNFTPLFVKDVVPKLDFNFWPEPGILFHPFIVVWIFFTIYPAYFLSREIRKTTGVIRVQLTFIAFATIIGYLGGATNYLLWYDIPVPPVGNWTASLYLLIITYAIVKYRLMDIRFALSRGAIYLFSLITIVGLSFSLMLLAESFFSSLSSHTVVAIVITISVLVFPAILRSTERFAARHFHYTFYNQKKVLSDLGKKLTRILDINELSLLIVNTLRNTMKLNRTVVLLKEGEGKNYIIQKNIGFKEENGISLVKDNFLTSYLGRTQKLLVYEELSLIAQNTKDKKEKEKIEILQENMKKIEASLCIPLLIKDKIFGIIVLGNKASGDPYFEQDVDFLAELANQISVALENAKLYSEVQDLSQNLEKKVEDQVKELKKAYGEMEKAYKKLEGMDKVKTEFMSIVSHQLRTPLSIIKGYLSMILEGSFRKNPGKQKNVIKNVYDSNERLIKLVNDVLNISRIQAGRVQLNLAPGNIIKVVRETTNKMRKPAEEKGIDLVFKEPKTKLPNIYFDENKIENILINLIDNSTKYTNEGSITLSVCKKRNRAEIMLQDTGAGMGREEIEKLFETFSRGSAGQRFWTEGAGLGLYIAKQFIEMHKGSIKAESDGVGKGSRFYVRLPLDLQP